MYSEDYLKHQVQHICMSISISLTFVHRFFLNIFFGLHFSDEWFGSSIACETKEIDTAVK